MEEDVERRLTKLEDNINELKIKAAVDTTRIDQVYASLLEIKVAVDGIKTKLDAKNEKPMDMIWQVVGAVIIGAVMYFIGGGKL